MAYSSSSLLQKLPLPLLSTVSLLPSKSRVASLIIAIEFPLQAASTCSSTPGCAGISKLLKRPALSSTPNLASSQIRIRMNWHGNRSSNRAWKGMLPITLIHCVWLTIQDKKSTKMIKLSIGTWPSMSWNSERKLRKRGYKKNAMKFSKENSSDKSKR